MRHVHHWERWCRTVMSILLLSVGVHVSFAQCVLPGTAINFSSSGQTTTSGYSTSYVLTDATGSILQTVFSGFAAPNADGSYRVYAINYQTGTGSTAPTLTAGTNVTAIGGSCVAVSSSPLTFCVAGGCVAPGTVINLSLSGNNTAGDYTTSYVLATASGTIVSSSTSASVAAPATGGAYAVYAVNYSTASGSTAPTLTAGTSVSAIGGSCVAISNSPVSFTVCAAPASPVAVVNTNPSSAGSSTGAIDLTASTGAYPASKPVSVTYTTPAGTTAVYTGTTSGTGKITIPNLPAGTYGPFTVAIDGGIPSAPGGSATLVDPAPSTPVAAVGSNPTTGGSATGSITLTGTGGAYPASTPVSVTYTSPTGTTTVYTGTTDAAGKITIPNLPAGEYGPFVVSVNGGTPTNPSNKVTLVDPVSPTPVAVVNANPTTPGTATGSISLTGTTTTYRTNKPVSVTYTTPAGTTAVYTGTTDGSGKITIPNLVAGEYGPFIVSVDGDTPSSPSNKVTLVDPAVAAATPVASVISNPTSAGTSTGSISLTGTTGAYPANSPVSVTYTTPSGTSAVFTGTTDGNGLITIPNLPAGQYGPFVVAVNGGMPSSPSNTVTLVDPAVAAASPVASVGNQPTSPGTSTGSISLSASTGTYPANTPVSVTYTTPTGTATYTGTTDGNGVITIPNLPAGQYGPFTVAVNGGTPSTPAGSATLVDPAVAAATPVASVVNNPTSAGTSTGSISLTGTTGAYPANSPVSVTYTTPAGTSATYAGTTDGSGKITIPNLPAGQYGPFVVAVNGGTPSNPSNTVTLVDPTASPVASVGNQPTAPGTSTGSINLVASTGTYPANTPVSVTYTTPTGTATFTGTTDGNGKIIIPNLPAGQYGPFSVAVNGGAPSTPAGSVTLTDPAAAPATPVASVVSQPIAVGSSTGSISLTGTSGNYPASTPVSVTYTTPAGTTAVYTGTTDATGKITIPNLPAGQYGPFRIALNGGTPSASGGSVTLVDPVGGCLLPGTTISFSNSGANTASGYVTSYVVTNAGGYIVSTTTATSVAAPLANGSYSIYAVNYNTATGYTAPTLTTGTALTAIGGSCVAISASPLTFCVTGGCLAPGTVVSFANSGANTASGYTTTYALVNASGAIVSTSTATSVAAPSTAGTYSIYAINYSTASGSVAPTLTAGTAITAIGGSCVAISSTPLEFAVCELPDLTPIITALPGTVHNTTQITVAVDIVELKNVSTTGPIKVYVSKDSRVSLSFDPLATSIGGQPVLNSAWSFDGSSNTSYYILTTSQVISGGGVLSFGFTGTLTPGATKGQLTLSTVILAGSGNETRLTNNVDADKIDYFPQ